MQNRAKIGIGVGVGVVVLIAVVVIVVVTTSGDKTEVNGPWDQVRLPSWIKADRYNLNLNISWKNMSYNGTQEITVNVTDDADYILVHSRGLIINSEQTLLMSADNTKLDIAETFRDSDRNKSLNNDFYIVKAKKTLKAGRYKVKIFFSGSVAQDKLTGVYKSKYIEGDGQSKKEVYQVSTDFEPVDARSAFPCLDEPDQKGKWTITITTVFPKDVNLGDYSIISNMEADKEVKDDKTMTITTSFKESVPMSTYLVCFAISNFNYQEGVYKRDDGSEVKLRVFARRSTKFQDSAKYALEVTKSVLKKYEEFYKVPYPLNKLDQIALPEFNSGAMENWGIVTYRESSLLYDPESSSNDEKQRVCAVIAHELAHQWFGNIVTMAWWNDLWLNEGFASFVEYYGMDAHEPAWHILDFMYPDEITTAMTPDSSPSSHPISVDVERPEDISGLFDTISYRKGSSINYMMMNFMGKDENDEKRFNNGIQKYIETYQYKNAEMIDLFNSLNEAADGINVTEIMLTWTMQMGFPYVIVKRNTEGNIVISQKRFLVGEKKADDTSEFDYKWHIPFTYISDVSPDEPNGVIWLTPDKEEEVIPDSKDLNWVKGNAHGLYYYIVHYEDATIKEELAKATLNHTVDRASLVHDAFKLASIGEGTYEGALAMTKNASTEKQYIALNMILNEVISAANSAINKNVDADKDVYKKYQTYIANMVKTRVTDLGWESKDGETFTDPKLRSRVLKTYCLAVEDKDDDTVKEALLKFDTFKENKNREKIKNVLDTVVRTAIKYDEDNKNWDALFDILKTSDWEAAQREYLRALSMTTNLTTIDKLLDYGETDAAVLDPWRYIYYANFYGKHYDHCWKRLKDNWEYYANKYNGTSFTMGYLLEIPSVYDTEEKLTEVEEFLNRPEIDATIGTGRKAKIETLDAIRTNIEWKKKYADSVKKFFNDLTT